MTFPTMPHLFPGGSPEHAAKMAAPPEDKKDKGIKNQWEVLQRLRSSHPLSALGNARFRIHKPRWDFSM